MAIGIRLKEILKQKKMTVKQLSENSGVSENTLYGIIKRDNKTINPDIATKITTALEIKIADLMGISDYLEDAEQAIHETTSFKDYLGVLGYEVHESPYNDKWVIHIKDSDVDVYISDEEMNTLERTTVENIDLRITKYMSDGKHNQ